MQKISQSGHTVWKIDKGPTRCRTKQFYIIRFGRSVPPPDSKPNILTIASKAISLNELQNAPPWVFIFLPLFASLSLSVCCSNIYHNRCKKCQSFFPPPILLDIQIKAQIFVEQIWHSQTLSNKNGILLSAEDLPCTMAMMMAPYQRDQKKLPNVYKSCLKLISLENDRFWHLYKNCLRMWEIWAN